jgi:antitoxin (DNA-binding transcriptional repressor) of toxin-antitoxin stability system
MANAKPRTINVHEAKTNFSKLLKRVERGEEVIIARAGQPVARISRLATDPQNRSPGSAKGLIQIADDFDAPIPDLERAFED